DPLQAAVLWSDVDGWGTLVEGLQERWGQADSLARANRELLDRAWFERLRALQKEIQRDHQDWQLAKALSDIRLRASTSVDGKWQPGIAVREYPRLFQSLHLDLLKGDIPAQAAAMRQLRLRYILAAALDDWAIRASLSSVVVESRRELQAR